MKIKDLAVGGVYAYKKHSYSVHADRVVLVSKDTYRETDSSEQRHQTGVGPFAKYGRGDKKPYSRFDLRSGLLVLELRDDADLDEARKISVDDVVGNTLRLQNTKGVWRVQVVQSRLLVDEWDAFEVDRIKSEAREAEHKQQEAVKKADELPRMQEVVRVLRLLNDNHYWRVAECVDNSRLEVKLEDLEALIAIAKAAVPAYRPENADS